MSTPGRRLKEQREKLGKQQKEVAHEVHKAPSTYKSWEQDRTRPKTWDDVVAVCKVLGITPQHYLSGEEWEMELPELLERLMKALDKLPEHQQAAIVEMVEKLAQKEQL